MKKGLKKWIAGLAAILCCVSFFTPVLAGEVKGTVTGHEWAFNPDTGTLRLSGEGYGTLDYPPYGGGWWDDYNSQIRNIVLAADAKYAQIPRDGADVMPNVQLYSGTSYGIDWEIDFPNHTLSINGKGEIHPYFSLYSVCLPYSNFIDHLVIGDGITSWQESTDYLFGQTFETVYLGKNVRLVDGLDGLARTSYEVSPENRYLSAYDGALYTKDFRKLVGLPLDRPFMKLHPKTKNPGPKVFSGKGDGYSWNYDAASRTLTMSGKNYSRSGSEWSRYSPWIDRLVLGNGITSINTEYWTGFDTVVLGKDVRDFTIGPGTVKCDYEVDSRNKYFAAYDGALYTKDYHKLLLVPSSRASINFHPDLETVGSYAFGGSCIQTIVLPDGIKTLEDYALSGTGIVVLPDSAVVLGDQYGHYDDNLVFFYSDQNKAANQKFSSRKNNLSWGELHSEFTWEQLRNEGKQVKEGWQNLRYIDQNGKQVSGWKKIDGKLYRFNTIGSKITGWYGYFGQRYYFGDDGVYKLGFRKIDGKTYYFDETKGALTGWQDINGSRYFFNLMGEMQTGTQTILGKQYFFNSDGTLKA